MNLLSAENIFLRYGPRVLLDHVSFGIEQGQKIALVGVNGCGKSTFLRILAGEDEPNEGTVARKNGLNLAYLSQKPEIPSDITVLEAILDSDDPIMELVRDYEQMLQRAQKDHSLNDELAVLSARMDTLNAWDYESRAREILGKLNLHDLDQLTGTLSGGQHKRVGLARVLLRQPDLLILDEPTNHLDLDVIEWLEDYLDKQQMALLMVTHDRYFLERVTDQIVELDKGKLYTYPGSYTDFLEKKEERHVREKVEADKARNLLRKELEWLRRQPKARGTKAKYRVEGVDKLKKQASAPKGTAQVNLGVKERRLGGKIIELSGITKQYGGETVFPPFSYIFHKGEKVGIIGPNGTGKTTFLEVISGMTDADEGEVVRGVNTQIGYFRQQEPKFEDGKRVIDIVRKVADVVETDQGNEITASQMLQRFNFEPAQQYDIVDKLSGGEKRRLQLLLVLIRHPNFLILDEPTNDLDLITLQVLEEFLLEFKGCLLVVSHDRYFMDRITDHLFIFEKGKEIRDFNGTYDDFRLEQNELREIGSEKKNSPEPDRQKERTKSTNKLSYKEKREMESLDTEIERLTARKGEIEKEMNSGVLDHEQLMKLSMELQELTGELDDKEMRWLELSEKDQ
ncbi:MAG: ABC-F family ATP-binding cassette domain-containing protein [Cyclobacteriaceae bacterium]